MPVETITVPSRHDNTPIEIKVQFHQQNETAPAVILAHPYGPLGGSMNNNVVIALERYFTTQGFITVSLNFRGSGASKGRTSWTGRPERGDYEAVIQHTVHSGIYGKVSHLIIAGYSFGSIIASSVAPENDLTCSYLLISYPYSVQWFLTTTATSYFRKCLINLFDTYGKQKDGGGLLFVYGGQDQFTGEKAYKSLVANHVTGRVNVVEVQDADHFWYQRERQLIQHVDAWIAQHPATLLNEE